MFLKNTLTSIILFRLFSFEYYAKKLLTLFLISNCYSSFAESKQNLEIDAKVWIENVNELMLSCESETEAEKLISETFYIPGICYKCTKIKSPNPEQKRIFVSFLAKMFFANVKEICQNLKFTSSKMHKISQKAKFIRVLSKAPGNLEITWVIMVSQNPTSHETKMKVFDILVKNTSIFKEFKQEIQKLSQKEENKNHDIFEIIKNFNFS